MLEREESARRDNRGRVNARAERFFAILPPSRKGRRSLASSGSDASSLGIASGLLSIRRSDVYRSMSTTRLRQIREQLISALSISAPH